MIAWLARILTQYPLTAALVPLLGFFVLVFSQQWVPVHDTLSCAAWAHYLMSGLYFNGEVPLWAPYLDWGKTTHVSFLSTLHPSIVFLSPLIRVFPKINTLTLYYLSFVLDEMILLIGSFALGRKLFSRIESALFVSISLVGSSLWFAEAHFNFHLYYAVPLTLYLIWTGCENQKPARIVFAFVLHAITASFGNALYMGIISGLACVVFLISCCWSLSSPIKNLCIHFGWRAFATMAVLAVTLALPAFFLLQGAPLASLSPGRGESGAITYESFLKYGADVRLQNLSGLTHGVSRYWESVRDSSIYAGLLVVPLMVIALLFARSRRQVPFWASLIFLVLFYVGDKSFIAPLLYYVPIVGLYRHVGFITPLMKVFTVFIAGFGFEVLVGALKRDNVPRYIVAATAGAIMLFAANFLLKVPSMGINTRTFLVALLYLGFLVTLFLWWVEVKTFTHVVIPAILLIVIFDVYSFKTAVFHDFSVPVSRAVWDLFRVRKQEFRDVRISNYFDNPNFSLFASHLFDSSYSDDLDELDRLGLLDKNKEAERTKNKRFYGEDPNALLVDGQERVPRFNRQQFADCLRDSKHCVRHTSKKWSVICNIFDQFLSLDPCFSLYRLDTATPAVRAIYGTLDVGEKQRDTRVPYYLRIQKGLGYPGALQAIGCNNAKVKVFNGINLYSTDKKGLEQFSADGATVFSASTEDVRNFIGKGDGITQPSVVSPVPARIEIKDFAPNIITMAVLTSQLKGNRWLYYADSWHPKWKAYVNGKEVHILKANYAFKAVQIPEGSATVQFVIKDERSQMVAVALWLCCVLFVVGIFAWGIKCFLSVRLEEHSPSLDTKPRLQTRREIETC